MEKRLQVDLRDTKHRWCAFIEMYAVDSLLGLKVPSYVRVCPIKIFFKKDSRKMQSRDRSTVL